MKTKLPLFIFSILLLLSSALFAQVGIGTNKPAASAALEVTSDSNAKGLLIPRLTDAQRAAIKEPAEGLLIYQTSAPSGFYFFTNGEWKLIISQTNGKDLSSNDYTTAEKTKLAAITGSNTGDQTTITGNAGTATKLATTRNINGVAFDGSADITIAAAASAEDLIGTTLKSTVTGSSLTSVGTLGSLTVTNPIVGSVTGNAATATNLTGLTTSVATLNNLSGTNSGDQTTITGNAGTATKLATARNINGVAFDGSADITIAATTSAEDLTGTTLKSTVTGSSLTSVGTLGSLTVTNPIVGSVTGNAATATNLTGLTTSVATLNNLSGTNSGDQTTITGNAGTATKLATTRNINGIAFDGSADITIAAAASAEDLTGTTLKSTVTGSSLTSVGTLANLTVTNPIVGSVTGNAATATSATTAGNITATSNSTLTSLANLATVGTINSGVWNGTAVAVEKGGTGATTASAARTNLGLANVDNTSDINKQVSIATQTAIDSKLSKTDTIPMLSWYKRSIYQKLNYTDTTAMLSSYRTRLDRKLNYTDTAAMLSSYMRKSDTTSLSDRINSKLNSTVIPSTNGVKGYIMYWNGSEWRLINPGTSGQVLKMSGDAEPVPIWGNIATVQVPSFSPCGTTITDIDGNVYNTVLIGSQCWTKENLRVRRYNNGTNIPFNQSGGSGGFSNLWQKTIGAHTTYANDSTTTPSNRKKYGYLYNWYAAKGIYTTGIIASTDTLNICPSGWHVPSKEEWSTMITELGGESVAGGKMKSTGTAYWNSPNTGATNETGFSALPGGYRNIEGSFNGIRNIASFWTISQDGNDLAFYYYLGFSDGRVLRGSNAKSDGACIRCVRDD